MDFRWPPGSAPSVPGGSPPAWFSHPQGPLPPPLREHIIREAVTRRLNEEWAMGVHGGFRPGPFFAPDRLMPPPHAPMPMPMHPLPHAPPPVPFEGFGAWQGPGPCRHAGFGERTPFPREERRASPPRPDPKRKVKLPEIEPSSGTPEVLSPKVPMMKRKADANAATTVPKKVQKLAEDWSAPSEAGLNEHLGGRKHKAKLAQCGVSKAIKDDKNCLQTTTGNENSTDPCDAPKKICMLVDGATCEAGLNEHLGGGKHKAKLALCGASKAIKDDKNSLHTTTGNKNNTDPCDAPKKIFLEVDGEMHEVVRKNNYLWCDRCRVRGDSNVIMAGHLRGKKHSKLNQVWTSIKAVRTNTNTKEGLPSCGNQVTPRLKELIMLKAQQEAKSDPSSAPKETYANDSSQKRKPSQMTSKVQPPAKTRKDNPPKKTVSSDDHRLKEQRADSRLQEAGEVSRGKAKAFVEMKVEGDSKGGNTSSNQPKPYLHSDKCTAYMSKINLKATELHIRGFFSDIGGVVDIRLQRDRFTKKSRGLAHVDFSDKDHLEAAIRKNKKKLFGKNVIIKDSSKRKKNRKAGTSTKANTKVWTSIKALLSKKVSIAPSDPSKSKKNREAGTSAKANTKVWTSIKAVGTNSNTKEGLPSSCGSQVNTNGSTKIPAVIEGDINMTTAVDESGPVENPVRKEITRMATIKAARTNTNTKEGLPSCGSQVNTDGSTEIPAVIEGDINMTTLVDESGPVENLVRKQITRMAAIKAVRTNTDTKEGLPSSCGSQVNTNGCTEIPAVIEGDLNMSTGVDESGPVENPVQKEITRMATIWAMFSS